MRLLLLFASVCALARADPLTDLRAKLATLTGRDPVRAAVTYAFWNRRGDDKTPIVQESRISALAEEGPEGLRVTWAPELVSQVAAELRGQSEDPEAKTPTRLAMNDLNAVRLNGYLNAAPDILTRLQKAQLLEETFVPLKGQTVRHLLLRLSPPLSAHDRKYVKELDATAQIWIGADGVPLSGEVRVRIKGRALLVLAFESDDEESLEFARTGDRLVVVRDTKRTRTSGAGEAIEQRTSASLTLGAP